VAGVATNPGLAVTGEPGLTGLLGLVFITTGAFLAGRRPARPVGWLLLGWGMVMAYGTFTISYVDRGLVRDPGSLPAVNWVAWSEGLVWHPAFALLAFLLLLCPHGRLPSPRWRPFARLTVAVYLVLSVSAASPPAPSSSTTPRPPRRCGRRSRTWPTRSSSGCSPASCCCWPSPWCRWCCACAGPPGRSAS
jgi:hypothetical protein